MSKSASASGRVLCGVNLFSARSVLAGRARLGDPASVSSLSRCASLVDNDLRGRFGVGRGRLDTRLVSCGVDSNGP